MTEQSRVPVVFLNGELIPFTEARLPIYDLAIVQGATVTERLRTVGHIPYLVDEHLARLDQSFRYVGWHVPGEFGSIRQAISDVTRLNTMTISRERDLSIVVFVTAGQALGDANGMVDKSRPTVCISTSPLPHEKWGAAYQSGLTLITPEVRQPSHDTLHPHIKMRSRLHWYLADQAARRTDPSATALLCNSDGHVTETSSGNLFIVKDGILATPPDENALLGIAREHVITLAENRGWKVDRRAITPQEVAAADEVFLTSSTYCILPVSNVNGTTIGTRIPGSVTKMLIDVWSNEIGLDFEKQSLDTVQTMG